MIRDMSIELYSLITTGIIRAKIITEARCIKVIMSTKVDEKESVCKSLKFLLFTIFQVNGVVSGPETRQRMDLGG